MLRNAQVPLTESATSAATRPLDAASAFHLNRHAPPASGWRRLAARLLPLAGAVCACGLPLAASAQCTPAPTNIVAWWPAEGHSYEIIRLREAALLNGAGYAPGKVGQAFSFDGPNERVQIIRSELRSTNRWTIEAWVKPANFTNSSYPTIYSEGARVLSLGLNNGTGKLESWINAADGARLISTLPVTNGVWNHVALTRNGNTRTLYVNGVAAGTTNSTPTPTAGSLSAIGHDTQDGSSTAFAGAVDELSIYHRALSSAEILAIYNAGSAGKCYSASNPEFVIQPVYQTNYLGATATFTALAMGSPAPSYQWLFNGSPLAGETNYTLTLTNLTFAHAGLYALRATSGANVATSAVARLTVRFCTDTPSGLVAWWPGDGSGLDVTSNHNGAVWGGVTYPQGVVINGPAFGFNGSDAYVAVPDSSALSPHVGTNGEMTLEAWVYLSQLPAATKSIVSKGDGGRWEYDFRITSTGATEFVLYQPNGTACATVSGGQITVGAWHHLVGTLKKGQFIRLYQDYDATQPNQVVVESTNFTGTTATNATPVYIGRRSDGQFLNGRVDEAALYNRALTTNEIATLYAGGAFGKCAGAATPAPFFAVQPANASGYYFLGGGLSALALGTPRPDYQWYRSNSPTTWLVVSNGANATLNFSNCNDALSGFRASVSNRYGVTTSQPAWFECICHPIVCATNGEGFEGGWNGWTSDNWVWQVGVPHSGPWAAHSGSSVAATVLDGNYPDDTPSLLVSPPFVVPPADQQPRLRFWHWWSFWCDDYGQVQVKGTNGVWEAVTGGYWTDSFGYWSRARVDLSKYAGQIVQVGFYFYSHNNPLNVCNGGNPDVSAGWYVDDLTIEIGEPPPITFPEGFEAGWGGWTVDYIGGQATDFGMWEIGVPMSGPGGTHASAKCAATVLNGNYQDDRTARLVSPPFVVPSADQQPRLRFWHWWSFWCDDYGQVQVKGTNGWQNLSQQLAGGGGGWALSPDLSLASYAGQTVRLGFYFYSHNNPLNVCNGGNPDVSTGWYVDDIFLVRGNITIVPIADKTVAETNCLTFPVSVVGGNADSIFSFSLGAGAPAGAQIDPETGVFHWCPSECQGPGTYVIPVYVVDYGNNEANDLGFVRITVNEVNEPPWLLPATGTAYVGQTNYFPLCSGDLDCPRNPLTYSLFAPVPSGATIDPGTGVIRWVPTLAQIGSNTFKVKLCDGGTPNYCVTNTVKVGVTAYAPYSLEVTALSNGDLGFTIHNGQTNVDYALQQTSSLCECPCQSAWQDVGRVSPSTVPYTFVYPRSVFGNVEHLYFRLNQVPR